MKNYEELQFQVASLEASCGAAMTSLGLESGGFAWFTGEVRYPMVPQEILPDRQILDNLLGIELEPKILHDTYSSNVTYYGGKAENQVGRFSCGHVQAHISEPIPEGAKHLSGTSVLPVPYIKRLLELHNHQIKVDTPTMNPSLNDGPLVIEGFGSNPRFRNVTTYDTETGELQVRHGQHITSGHGWGEDRTTAQNAFELPQDVLDLRVATMVRTIGATALIFDKISSGERDVELRITKEDPFARR
jgi:hypothetical protein